MSERSSQSISPATVAMRPEFVRLANRIAGQRRPLRFQWNGLPVEFSFSNLRLAPRGGWRLHIVLAGHDLHAELARLPNVAWISPSLAGIDIQELPSELACALIEACLGEIMDALNKQGVDMRITSVAPVSHRDASDEVIEWQVQRDGDPGWMRGSIAGEDAALECLATLVQKVPVAKVEMDESLPMPVNVVAGGTRLSLESLRSVEIHDVILADLSPYARERSCVLTAGGKTYAEGHLNDRVFTLHKLTPIPPVPMVENAANSLNDLEIELTFVLGRKTLTIGELRGLAPGAVVELPISAAEGLAILANGKEIGRGEIIEVGDHLGVRVTSFCAP